MTHHIPTELNVTILASPRFDTYREAFTLQPPDLSRKRYDDELTNLTHLPCFSDLLEASTPLPEASYATDVEQLPEEQKYLWVIGGDYVKIAQEYGDAGKNTQRERLSHSNFTGGKDAFAGGELWFSDSNYICINGGSSRYTPRSEQELETIVDSFRESGYVVQSAGWDNGTNAPARFRRI
ncbi:hypothetical protein GHO41_15080 [Pseudomonas sp. FSL R10-0399]|uniref:hypothetical protein n=1 Tax=Pseudomonas sp. FSL R10-0399 TaxID=2662194 RepID=UPI0012970BF5|nr:hypothetical protein [Pseudomonas sp. FSL R10-0399]MQT58659.1 hypothetical protein [Pseudomonas sp. FSL R10-0399]